jgi:hypothetical protein
MPLHPVRKIAFPQASDLVPKTTTAAVPQVAHTQQVPRRPVPFLQVPTDVSQNLRKHIGRPEMITSAALPHHLRHLVHLVSVKYRHQVNRILPTVGSLL